MSDSPMSVKASEGGDYVPLPVGIYAARCAVVAGIGMQEGPYGHKAQCILVWQIPGQHADYGRGIQAAELASYYTLSLGTAEKPSNLRKVLEGWRGRPFTKEEEAGFELQNILNKACMLIVRHKPKKDGNGVRAVVDGCLPCKEQVPSLSEEYPVYYDAWNHDERSFTLLPEWIQKKVNRSGNGHAVPPEAYATAHAAAVEDGDEIPF